MEAHQLSEPEWEREQDRILDYMRQLIAHARINFAKSVEPSTKVDVCDRLAGFTDLLRALAATRAGYKVTLADLDDAAKAWYAGVVGVSFCGLCWLPGPPCGLVLAGGNWCRPPLH